MCAQDWEQICFTVSICGYEYSKNTLSVFIDQWSTCEEFLIEKEIKMIPDTL